MLADPDAERPRLALAADDLRVREELDERMPTGIQGLRP